MGAEIARLPQVIFTFLTFLGFATWSAGEARVCISNPEVTCSPGKFGYVNLGVDSKSSFQLHFWISLVGKLHNSYKVV